MPTAATTPTPAPLPEPASGSYTKLASAQGSPKIGWGWKVYGVALISLCALHLLVGIADQNDFTRAFIFLLDKPVGFFQNNFADPGDIRYHERYFTYWHSVYEIQKNPDHFGYPASPTIYTFYLILKLLFSWAVTGDLNHYNVIVASIPGRVIWLFGFALWMRQAMILRDNGTWVMSWPSRFLAIVLGFLVLEASFTSYLNSFYEEQMGIIFLPLLGYMMMRFVQEPSWSRYVSCMFMAALLSWAKTMYFLFPSILFVFMIGGLRQLGTLRRGVVIYVCLQATSLLVMSNSPFVSYNQYNSLYVGGLHRLNSDELDIVEKAGHVKFDRTCVRKHAYEDGGECSLRNTPTYLDTLRLFWYHPNSLDKLLRRFISLGADIHNKELGRSLKDGPDIQSAWLFNLWARAYAWYGNVVGMGLALLGCMVWVFAPKAGWGLWLRMGNLFGLMGMYQYASAIGDGLVETQKHLLTGNYALSLAMVSYGVSFFHVFNRQRNIQSATLVR